MSWSEPKYVVDKIHDKIDAYFPGHYAVFTSNGSFSVPKGLRHLCISAIGGGGGGGGGAQEGGTNYKHGGGGGGYAAYVLNELIDVHEGDILTITIGTGGFGGASGFGTDNTTTGKGKAGTNGTATVIKLNGTELIRTGYGTAGQGNQYASGYNGASGGSIGGGQSYNFGTTGQPYYGTGGKTKWLGTFGNGGDGGTSSSSGGGYGKAGNPGCVVITWGFTEYTDVARYMEWEV